MFELQVNYKLISSAAIGHAEYTLMRLSQEGLCRTRTCRSVFRVQEHIFLDLEVSQISAGRGRSADEAEVPDGARLPAGSCLSARGQKPYELYCGNQVKNPRV